MRKTECNSLAQIYFAHRFYVLTNTINVNTINAMQIEFDATKDEANQAKHGVSLILAVDLDWDSALVWQDSRKAYGEGRQSALALLQVQGRVYFVAYVDRGAVRRVISLRKANNREKVRYATVFDAS